MLKREDVFEILSRSKPGQIVTVTATRDRDKAIVRQSFQADPRYYEGGRLSDEIAAVEAADLEALVAEVWARVQAGEGRPTPKKATLSEGRTLSDLDRGFDAIRSDVIAAYGDHLTSLRERLETGYNGDKSTTKAVEGAPQGIVQGNTKNTDGIEYVRGQAAGFPTVLVSGPPVKPKSRRGSAPASMAKVILRSLCERRKIVKYRLSNVLSIGAGGARIESPRLAELIAVD